MVVASEITTDAYVPIPIATLSAAKATDFPLYIRDRDDREIRLYRDKDVPLSVDVLKKLTDRGIKNLYVSQGDHHAYQEYLRETFATVLSDPSVPGSQKCGCLNAIVRNTLSEAFASGDTNQTIETAKQLAIQTVDLVSQGEITASELINVMQHDFHTFTHSANVSYYCILLAKELGIHDQDTLNEIGTGGLLHDLGKLGIPSEILTKPGKLTDEEFAIIKSHPTQGFVQLSHREDLSFGQLMMVYQHHERMDGTGYPVGIGKGELHPWAEICAVADIFEALTSNRPYRTGMSRSEACELMDRYSGTHTNSEVWRCWKALIQQI